MCLDVYIHNTPREHDTRFPSILNPATGYSVYSPWQEPYAVKCDYPHIFEPIDPHVRCPWHLGCCRLERGFHCWLTDCRTRVKYHHFVDEEYGETNDLSFLGAYIGCGPNVLSLAAWFFKAGVELRLADGYRHQISQRLAKPDQIRIGDEDDDVLDVSERRNLEQQLVHFTHVAARATECLGQFAKLWDLNAGPDALPPRPGRQPDPELNASLSGELRLRIREWTSKDLSKHPWPQRIELWDEFQKGLIDIRDDPSLIPWAVGKGKTHSDPMTMPPWRLSRDSPSRWPNPSPSPKTRRSRVTSSFPLSIVASEDHPERSQGTRLVSSSSSRRQGRHVHFADEDDVIEI